MTMNRNILAIAHDAGGAEVISAYIKANPEHDTFFCIAEGPAKGVFEKRGLKTYCMERGDASPADIFNQLKQIDLALTGTSWSSDIEFRFLQAAKEKKIKTAVHLDHWVNYRERFGYPHAQWQNRLPDEFWVGDIYAKRIAEAQFPDIPIVFAPNRYFEEIKKEYAAFMSAFHSNQEPAILFMSEPVSQPVNAFGDDTLYTHTEYDILDALLAFFKEKHHGKRIIIRFHPSEKKDKYKQILARYADTLTIIPSQQENIYADIAASACVIGMDSMALVVAHTCGKKVISFIPDRHISCSLPFKEIIKIKDINALSKLISSEKY